MDEFSFINAIKQDTYKQSSVIKGVGDDAAVFRQSSMDIVIAKDMMVNGVHFTRNTMEAFHIGYRALAANISDIAAMGATPVSYLVAIVIPEDWSGKEIEQIYHGMKAIGNTYHMDLIGGDTVSGTELAISITVIGYVGKDNARYRTDAKDGDIVFVTGTLGDSQAGFHILTNPGNYHGQRYFKNRHRMPSPRVDFVQAVSQVPRLCLNDISDGIASEANEIAEASKVEIHLIEESIPVSEQYDQFPSDLKDKWKLFGGEDFELIGTVSPNEWTVLKQAAKVSQIEITKVGYVTNSSKSERVLLHRSNGKIEQLMKKGYNHLRR